ncbi:MAG: dihydroneopterin aldolase [Verrucomicrobia bacterium]|nr:dihydroneopterin aldolase [Verrucomicrobiota bacterium]
MKHCDKIEIRGLRISAHVGVPDEERESAQELRVDLIIHPADSLQGLSDDITKTIDYHQVAMQVQAVAETGSRRLIETLAEDVAGAVLDFEGVEAVEVKVKKYILPDTDFVSVTVCVERE